MGSGTDCADDPADPADSGRDQMQRVEGLLASVQDLVASLQKAGTELEHEVARALYRNGPASGSAQATLELENARLKNALEGRALIEQAKGMIIAAQGGTAQEAFGVLTQISRREDRSLREVAAGVIESGARAARERNARVAKELLAQGPVSPDDTGTRTRSTPPRPPQPTASDSAAQAPAADSVQSTGSTTEPAGAASGPAPEPGPQESAEDTQSASATASSEPPTMIDQLTADTAQDPVRRRWRPSAPTHASGRRNAPKFRSSSP